MRGSTMVFPSARALSRKARVLHSLPMLMVASTLRALRNSGSAVTWRAMEAVRRSRSAAGIASRRAIIWRRSVFFSSEGSIPYFNWLPNPVFFGVPSGRKPMKKITLAAAVSCALATTLALAGPFDAFKGKMKEGLYETKVEMDMGQIPGAPPGMGKQTHTHQHCVTAADIEKGGTMGKGRDGKGLNES